MHNFDYSPHLYITSLKEAYGLLKKRIEGKSAVVLNVGGREGSNTKTLEYCGAKKVIIMDIIKSKLGSTIIGDICGCPHIPSNTFDVVFSSNLFEHLKEPWKAAEEMVRICKPGGVLFQITVFSWRYHPAPVDFYRYTHSGLSYLFERTGEVNTLLSGYDIGNRRGRGSYNKIKDCSGRSFDKPPIDRFGGWLENWKVFYIAEKILGVKNENSRKHGDEA